jgi:hypothetical protein
MDEQSGPRFNRAWVIGICVIALGVIAVPLVPIALLGVDVLWITLRSQSEVRPVCEPPQEQEPQQQEKNQW